MVDADLILAAASVATGRTRVLLAEARQGVAHAALVAAQAIRSATGSRTSLREIAALLGPVAFTPGVPS